jgi:hypothetical protein
VKDVVNSSKVLFINFLLLKRRWIANVVCKKGDFSGML